MSARFYPLKRFGLFLLILLGFFSGVYLSSFVDLSSWFRTASPSLINPILKYPDLEDRVSKNKPINLTLQLEKLIQEKKTIGDISHLSVYFRNLNNGGWFGINEKETFSPASLMKLPVLLAYLKKAEQNPSFLEMQVIYKEDPRVASYKQNIPPEKQLVPGNSYSLWDILQYMITYSDNHASLLLESMLSLEDLHHTFTDLGILFPQVVSGNFDNNLKIVDYAAFFRVLFNASYLTKESSQKALELLTHTDFTGGLVAGVSNSDILVAHKFGERGIIGANGIEEKQLHDCGIVYYPDRPYILCVMTRGLDWSKLQQTIADISKMVYEEVASKYR